MVSKAMIKHALTLEHAARELNGCIGGWILCSAWTQEKNACRLGFCTESGQELYITLSVDPTYGTVTRSSEAYRAKKNTIDIFAECTGHTLRSVTAFSGDRILIFDFGDMQIQACFYSGGKGNVLVTRNSVITNALHHTSRLRNTHFSGTSAPIKLPPVLLSAGMPEEDVIARFRASREFYILDHNSVPVLSAIPIPGMSVISRFNSVLEALQQIVAMRRKADRKNTDTDATVHLLTARLTKLRRSYYALKNDALKSVTPETLRSIGDALLSQPVPMQTGVNTLELTLPGSDEPITVQLRPEISLVENARRYYEKARKAQAAANERLLRLPRLETEIQKLEQLLLHPESIPMDVKQKHASPPPPYRIFQLEQDYTLYVGRNSANNDQLTMKFAKQNDYWFHVRGQSGSHCVLRSPDPSVSKPPKKVIEQAAAIAAYYSSARNAGWTPVIYTQRKYVRKPKGAAVGAVVVDRETVVMVKPELPDGVMGAPDANE